jgi:hypothetical protein
MKQHRTKRKTKDAADADRAGALRSVEDLRYDLARKLEMFAADWRRCPRRLCRRKRACQPPASGCPSPRRSNRPMTEAQWERQKAWLLRALGRGRDGFAAGASPDAPNKPV